ncbi:MAG: cytochrome c, class [Proteobacteria bacterium]|nr:cytochrome c, class [Pseudomonadota bacterium]MBS1210390.1 cytochrome c, class [Pseudomonadota bacterium]
MPPILARLILLTALCLPLAGHAGDPAEGNKVFEDKCADCHSMEAGKNKRGPSLAGVIGRKSGTVANYHYSEAMATAGIVWSPARLAQYLASPKTDVPGTKMRLLSHPSPAEMSALISWLQQAH